MNIDLARELLNELGSSLEALETQNTALLQFLKEKGIVTDEQLAPYIDQAGNASSVRWRATRVRLERVLDSATKEEEKIFERLREQASKAQAPQVPTEQKRSTNQQPEDAAKKKTQSNEHPIGEGKKEEVKECGWKDGDSGDSAEKKTVSNEKTKEST